MRPARAATRSRPSWSRASWAQTRCPMCGGLNVPPRTPSVRATRRHGTHVAVALDHVLVGAQLAQADRAAGVELLGRVADLGAHAELAAVGEARRRVDVDAGRVDAELERARRCRVARDDRLRVAGAVRVDVLDRLLDGVDDADGEHEREELRRPSPRRSRRRAPPPVAGERRACARRRAARRPRPRSAAQRARQERRRGVGVDEQRLGGVADARTLRLGVDDDRLGGIEVGARRRRRRGSCPTRRRSPARSRPPAAPPSAPRPRAG